MTKNQSLENEVANTVNQNKVGNRSISYLGKIRKGVIQAYIFLNAVALGSTVTTLSLNLLFHDKEDVKYAASKFIFSHDEPIYSKPFFGQRLGGLIVYGSLELYDTFVRVNKK